MGKDRRKKREAKACIWKPRHAGLLPWCHVSWRRGRERRSIPETLWRSWLEMVLCTSGSYGYGISEKMLVREKASAPILEKRHRKYFLRFSYKEEVTLTKTPVKEQIICSVDLGINTDAVCTIMRADGTVLGRRLKWKTKFRFWTKCKSKFHIGRSYFCTHICHIVFDNHYSV